MTVFFFFFPCFSCPPLQKFSATLQVFFSFTRLGPSCFNFYYFIWISLINWFFSISSFIIFFRFIFCPISFYYCFFYGFWNWFLFYSFILLRCIYMWNYVFIFLLLFFNPDKFLKLFFFITSLNLKLNLLIGSGSRI